MHTQCPHCDTRFRVTESQVNTADGFVRCSVCQEVFNAFEVAVNHKHQTSLLDTEQLNNDPPHATDRDESYLADQVNTDFNPLENDSLIEKTQQEPFELTSSDGVDFNETSATDDSRRDAFDFFDEEANKSLSHVVPEQFKDSYASGSARLISNLLWSIGTLLMVATLVIEYAWFNRDQLNQAPQIQAWTEKFCQRFECKNIAMRNPAKIELISRNVYSHPNEKNALMVNITMKNHADFAQPYPVMQINFSDIRGTDVAARRFLPTEYLPAEILQSGSEQLQLLEPDTNMTFTMEIQDPGKQAMTYEFNFL